MTVLPPLRIPRSLLDPQQQDLGCGDADGLLAVVLEIGDGRITAIRPVPSADPAALAAPLAITPPVDPHVHLDKTFTWGPYPNRRGSMAAAMVANAAEHRSRDLEGVMGRAGRALDLAWRQGLRALRSHVDSFGTAAEPSWEALQALSRDWAGRVELQLVALAPLPHWGREAGQRQARRLAGAGALLGGVLGPPYDARSDDRASLRALLRLASDLGCGVDLHVDEGADHPGRGLQMLCDLLEREPCPVPITCSHSASFCLLPEPQQRRLADRLAALGVVVVALPVTNFWLLGRRQGHTAVERPVAPVRLLQQCGVAVAVGADNVQDAWFPGGSYNPLDLLRLSVVTLHLPPWHRQGLMPFTTVPSRLLQLPWDGVLRRGSPADLLVLGAGNWSELLATSVARRVMRSGRWLEAAPPPPGVARLAGLMP